MKRILIISASVVLVFLALHPVTRGYGLWLMDRAKGAESQCFGSVGAGRLAYGVWLPYRGTNFKAYHWAGWLAGRANAHTMVKTILLDSYQALARDYPDLHFTYGEISWPWGGRLWPHITHRNGEAVDFFVPIRLRSDDKSRFFPTSLFDRLGYDYEFDGKGESKQHIIDFDAIAAHLLALDAAARRVNAPIRRVIFDPKLQPFLFRAKGGSVVKQRFRFSTRRSWVRHDEHYHVEFDLPCQ